jgi:DNA (cytosine-5)-methyltransferase 1
VSLTYGSVCSGIEAATVAWHPLGWRASFVSEIEAFPRAVLTHRWPEIPLHGDFTTIQAGDYDPIDLLVGGTPCQSFSVAGLRGGLADDRGNLALEFLRLADRLRPRWLVWENVPGVLSSAGGRDFGAILGGLVELGYGFAYRVLDAQFFGVAQRRRRVFVVGHLGDWRRAAAVLFERDCLSGNPAPRREKGPGVAALTANGVGTCGAGDNQGQAGHLIAFGCNNTAGPIDIATAVNAHGGACGRMDFESETFVAHSLRGEGFDASEDGTGRGVPLIPVTYSIMPQNSGKDYKARPVDATRGQDQNGLGIGEPGAPMFTLDQGSQHGVAFALRGREGGAMPEIGGDQVGALRAASGGSTRDYVAFSPETMYGVTHGTPPETGPDQALRALRDASDEEAFTEWGLGIDAAFRAAEILRSEVHGAGLRRPPSDGYKLGDHALSREEVDPAWPMLTLWQAGCVGCPPRGWRPPERLARELVAHLSELPRQGTPNPRFMLGLWRSSEGLGALRQALSATETAWRSAQGNYQAPTDMHGLRGAGAQSGPLRAPLHASQTGEGAGLLRSEVLGSAVRRLTPRLRECERLQGFADDYTLIPWRNGMASDGPRYKALGNSMAVPVMAWIGRRIQQVEALSQRSLAA